MGNDYVLKIVTWTISVLKTDISQISVSALQNEIPSLLSKCGPSLEANLWELHMYTAQNNES